MENFEMVKAIEDFQTRLNELEKAIHVDEMKDDIKKYDDEMNNPSFWNDQKKSSIILKKSKILKNTLETFNTLK